MSGCAAYELQHEASRHEPSSQAMVVAQRVVEEVLGTCRQQALLALRRSVLPATPIRSSRKSELIADIAADCDTPTNRQRIFAEVLDTWSLHELRVLIARLMGARLHGPSGPEAPEAAPEARLDSSHCQCGGVHCHGTHCEQAEAQGHMF